MNLIPPYFWVLGILFVSTLTHSVLGFGNALIAMPLLAMVVGIKTATPLVALVLMTVALTIALRNWRIIEWRSTWRLVMSSLLGIPLGLLLLKGVSEAFMRAFLGVIVILFSLYNLVKPNLKITRDHVGLAYLVGFLAGVLGGAYNTSGPPIVIYSTLRRWSPGRFLATIQSYFWFTGILILIGHGVAGLWNSYVFRLYGISLPVVFVAIFLGGSLNRSIPRKQFNRYVNVALVLIGLLLLALQSQVWE